MGTASSGYINASNCQSALSHNILIANGALFFPDRQGYNALRLSFTHKPEAIERSISVLGKLLKEHQLGKS